MNIIAPIPALQKRIKELEEEVLRLRQQRDAANAQLALVLENINEGELNYRRGGQDTGTAWRGGDSPHLWRLAVCHTIGVGRSQFDAVKKNPASAGFFCHFQLLTVVAPSVEHYSCEIPQYALRALVSAGRVVRGSIDFLLCLIVYDSSK